MKAHRVWIETVGLGTAIACVCALLIAIFAAAGATITQPVPVEAAQPTASAQSAETSSAPMQTFEGMVTCSHCGAKHSAALGRTASDCTRECVHSGASFALVEDDRTYPLTGDLMALKKIAGERARLMGTLHGNTIHVSAVAPAN